MNRCLRSSSNDMICLMCRFVAYQGKHSSQLKTILTEWPNSLISQSRLAKESRTLLNGDGFGLGWYNHDIDEEPAIFRSVRPAWNDANLLSIASKVLSKCYLAHIRASTVGDVSLSNCHPFSYKDFLFAHNGTVHNFSKIRKKLLYDLGDVYFNQIKGQTDSEHLFMKLMSDLDGKQVSTTLLYHGLKSLRDYLDSLFREINEIADFRINSVITNGHIMAVTRYSNLTTTPPHSLYFSSNLMKEAIIVASEKLTESENDWQEIPPNHILLIEEDLTNSLKSF